MGSRRTARHDIAFAIFISWLAAVGLSIYFVSNSMWQQLLWSGSTILAIPAWLFAIKAPTRCGVVTQRGHPCPNPTYGVLFGCGSAVGHTWTKFFARLGWRRPALVGAYRTTDRSAAPTEDEVTDRSEPVLVRVEGDRKATTAFWLAVAATFAGVTSGVTDVIGLFNG